LGLSIYNTHGMKALLLLLPCLLLAACGPASGGEPLTLTVFAAASLNEPFTQIGEQFEQAHPGASVQFNFAGSQQLAQQLANGAPADVFASANQSSMEQVMADGLVQADKAQIFAHNQLVVITPLDAAHANLSLGDLAQPGLHVLLAAPEVPAGQYALEFLEKAAADPAYGPQFKEGVLANVVSYEDNVKAVVAKILLGAADMGMVYASDVTGENAGKLGQIAIPAELNVTASYPIAPLKGSAQPALAQAFVDFILSEDGQAILAEHGFLPVEPSR
jgi:molybdate transport system substrate-binding protein